MGQKGEGMHMQPGIMELDLHGKNTYQARVAIDAALRRCGGGVYRLRLIHGYHSGTALRDLCPGIRRTPPGAAAGDRQRLHGAGAAGILGEKAG